MYSGGKNSTEEVHPRTDHWGAKGGGGNPGQGQKKSPQVIKQIGMIEQVFYRWCKEYGGMRIDQAKRLTELEKENLQAEAPGGRLVPGQLDSERGHGGKLLNPMKRRPAGECNMVATNTFGSRFCCDRRTGR